MLKEFLDALAEQSVMAAGPQHKEIDPTKTYVVNNIDGTTEFIGNQIPWRKHKAKDLVTLAAFAERFTDSSIWYSRSGITMLIDDSDRREQITVGMIWSDQINKLMELEKVKGLIDQRPLLHMLRTVFTPESLQQHPGLIDVLRKVTFTAGQKADADVQRGRSSVGKSLQVEATFQDKVPEVVTLNVPIFHNTFAVRTHPIECALEIWEAENKFQFFPLPGEVEAAFAAAEADICSSILALLGKASNGQIYYGTP